MKRFVTHNLVLLFLFVGVTSCFGTDKYLKVDVVFSNQMVLQRNCEIPIWGTSKPLDSIQVTFNKKSVFTTSDNQGNWKVFLSKHEAGGPYELIISTSKESIQFSDILVGEVWLASGQSNMHLDLKRTLNGEEVAKKANNQNIRIYNMRPTYPTGEGGLHTKEELERIQNNHYFETKGWVKVTPENVLYFSAVAYYFAEKLQEELNVPIGIIHNAIPGSPIESWLSKTNIKQDAELSQMVAERWSDKEDEKDAMITVAKNQISLSDNPDQRHPWMPNYGYINGILPIKDFAIKGVIWYQGESNAEQKSIYKRMFRIMVETWRIDFNTHFPFYFAQLSSREDRPAWPEFRNTQRELLGIVPNTKMIVTSDVGDRQDTHAKYKKPVGERFALTALGDTYGKEINYESPLFDTIINKGSDYNVYFKGKFNELKTSDKKEIRGFEISKEDINYEKISPIIQGSSVTFKLPKGYGKSFFIRYAWEPYSESNLVSGNNMPVSTFKTSF